MHTSPRTKAIAVAVLCVTVATLTFLVGLAVISSMVAMGHGTMVRHLFETTPLTY